MQKDFSILENAVLKTLAYFDIFDYPLSLFEIWKWLYNSQFTIHNLQENISISDVKFVLDNSDKLKSLIETRDGFYFFCSRDDLVKKRLYKYNIADKKFKKTIKVVKILKWMPFVRCIAVCNSLALSNAFKDSDIDLFIITSKKRIWSARFYIITFLKLFRLRPKLNNQKDKFCISFFADENNLNFEKLMFESKKNTPDIHFIYWLGQFVSVYDENVFNKMYEENAWIKKYLPNVYEYQTSYKRKIKKASFLKLLLEIIHPDFLESIYKWIQLKILPRHLKELAPEKDTRVVINNKLLKFHSNDRRVEYRNKFLENYENTKNN